ncbi:hypothetical protein KY359_06850 [Candidatus Woesearchaeota archaeon]|nr:hypothetical protein [Candidatus Woesearchaeota archaeon]
MQQKFDMINQEFAKRRSRLLVAGKAQRPTSHGYWASSEPMHVFELFRRLDLQECRSFLDLGSGDGVVVAIASLFTKAAGIEADPKLHKDAEDIRKKLGLEYALKNMDYLEEDLSQYDFIFINPDNYFHKLEKNIVGQFRGTLVIADNIFRPLTLSPEKQVSVRGIGYSVYNINQ